MTNPSILPQSLVLVGAGRMGGAMLRGWLGSDPDPDFLATWMQPEQIARVLVDLLAEGPEGRTGNSIGLYAGHPCVLPPPENLRNMPGSSR